MTFDLEKAGNDFADEHIRKTFGPDACKPVIDESMAEASVWAGSTTKSKEAIEWVAQTIKVKNVVAKDAPSAEAWGMRCWVTSSPVNEMMFWTKMWHRLLDVKKKEEEAEKQKVDDGRTVFRCIDQIEAAIRKKHGREILQHDPKGLESQSQVAA